MRTFILIALLVVDLGASIAHGMGSRIDERRGGAEGRSELSQSVSWYDGDRKMTVWLNPSLVAEFKPAPGSDAAIKKALPEARKLPTKQATMRLWQVDTAVNSLAATFSARNPSGSYSPVWHDGRSANASKRALPGGMLVTFKPGWNVDQVMKWTKKQGLVVERAMGFGNIYLIKTEAGIAALETANRIHESGEVVSASPNWWKEVVTR